MAQLIIIKWGLNTYSGYNQIQMHPFDWIHMALTTKKVLFYYKKMPFGLKNARATYQRILNKMFAKQIEQIMEVYIDDMVIKSRETNYHLGDIN